MSDVNDLIEQVVNPELRERLRGEVDRLEKVWPLNTVPTKLTTKLATKFPEH